MEGPHPSDVPSAGRGPGLGSTAGPGVGPLAGALVVAMCSGVSLRVWKDAGLIAREWAIYRRLAPRYGRIVFVSDTAGPDGAIAAELSRDAGVPIDAVTNDAGDDRPAFIAGAGGSVAELLSGELRVLVKTDQWWGGDLALAIVRALRRGPRTVALLARGGYPWSRFMAWEDGPDSPRASDAAAVEAELLRAADLVVGTTPAMVDDAAWRYGLSKARTRIVPNFLTDAAIQCAAPPSAARARSAPAAGGSAASDRDPSLVISAGRFEPQKRVDVLIDAIALVRGQGGSARLELIGAGSCEPALRARAAAIPASAGDAGPAVRFRPRMDHADLLDAMRRCAVYAQASGYEGHPKSVLEALAAGAAVVVANSPGLADVVRHGETGFVVAGDAASFAGAIERLIADPGLRASTGAAAAASVRSLHVDRVINLELAAHRDALDAADHAASHADAAQHATASSIAVRWDPELLRADPAAAAAAWARSMQGYSRRLPPDRRARFAAEADTPLAEVIDRAAIESAGGVHPKHRVTRYHDFFVERIGRGDRVLDLGCGYGAVALSIADRSGASVTGLDWNQASLDQARSAAAARGVAGRTRFLKADITAADHAAAGELFDVIVLSNVLEHLRGRPALLRRWTAAHSPRAVLVRVPAFDRSWVTAWKRDLGVDHRCDPTHETEYTEASLLAELRDAGLRAGELIVRWGEYWAAAIPA